MSDMISVHVFVAKTGMTAEILQDVYGMTDVIVRAPLGFVSGFLAQDSIDSLRALNVEVYHNQEQSV
jgi:hypothetical protein